MKARTFIVVLLIPFVAFCKDLKPLEIVENKGQITDQYHNPRTDIDAKIQANGVTMFIGNGAIHYQWVKPIIADNNPTEKRDFLLDSTFVDSYYTYRLDVVLVGSNLNAKPTFDVATGYCENYYNEKNIANGIHASAYKRLTYKDVYPNIDWILYITNEGVVKYDFIVHPNGDIHDIKLRFEGATQLSLNNGNFVANTPYGSISEAAPYCYEKETGNSIESNFVLNGNILSFNVGQHKKTLVIDPVLKWATYYGGNVHDVTRGCVTDIWNNGYILGYTTSSNLATSGAHQTVIGGDEDFFLAKFDTSGARLWATYIGGSQRDRCEGGASDLYGNVYLSGWTYSDSLATSGTFQPVYKGQSDGLLAKFNDSGSLVWSTYYGGTQRDGAGTVACDPFGAVMIVGLTESSGMSTPGTFHTTPAVGGFIAKFDSSGSRVWGTYFPLDEAIEDIHADKKGNIYISGYTKYTSGIATSGTHQPNHGSVGDNDGYVVKFDSTGNRVWGTYYGGAKGDVVEGTTTDNYGNVFICGRTHSSDKIATSGALQNYPNNDGTEIGFIAALDSTGNRLWGTYYGGRWTDIMDITRAVDRNIYIVGFTFSDTNIHTINAHQNYLNRTGPVGYGSDCLFAAFTPDGIRKYGTYFGGNESEGGYRETRIGISHSGKAYFVGGTNSTTGLATTGAFQTTLGPHKESFMAQFQIGDTLVYIVPPFINKVVCTNDTLYVPFGVTNNFNTNNIFRIQLSDNSGSFSSPITLKTVNGNTGDTVACTLPVNTPNSDKYKIRIIASSPVDTSEVNFFSVKIAQGPDGFVATSTSAACSGDSIILSSNVTNAAVNHSWTGPNGFKAFIPDTVIHNVVSSNSGKYKIVVEKNGCYSSDSFNVTVNNVLSPSVSLSMIPNHMLFPNEPVTFIATPTNAGNNPSYQWMQNGTNIVGATYATWGVNANQFTHGDELCAIVYSDYSCPNPDTAKSNCITVQIKVGVDDVASRGNIHIYPNPVSDDLIVTGVDYGTIIRLCNIMGQNVHTKMATKNDCEINMQSMASGIYILYVIKSNSELITTKVVKQ